MVTTSDLGSSLNQLQTDLHNEFGKIYDVTSNLQSAVNELQFTVNEIWQRLGSFDNCVVMAAENGAQTDLLGFADTLKTCIRQ